MNIRLLVLMIGCCCCTPFLTAQTLVRDSFRNDGRWRTYNLYIPAAYAARGAAVPLVLNLHGLGSNAVEQDFYANFRPIADTANFIVVQPNGTTGPTGQFWNSLGGISSVDDVRFLSDLIDTIQRRYSIDPQRIYSTGMSNGGFMSYDLACRLSNRIAAIASVTGSMIEGRISSCRPLRPVPVMQIHGTIDNTVPYNGTPLLRIAAIESVVQFWVNHNQCNPVPLILPVPNVRTDDASTAERRLFSNGRGGSTVEFYRVEGGGHTWPGAPFIIGPTNQDFSASAEIWRFFRQHRLGTLPLATAAATTFPGVVYPNPAHSVLHIESPDGVVLRRMCLTDLTGRQLLAQEPATAATTVVVAQLPSGIYLLQLEGTEGQRWVQRVVKQ